MDEGRYKDLAKLQAVIDNSKESNLRRLKADRSKQDIVRQLKDRNLRRLRERLIRAAQNYDEYEEWKISSQIKDYLKKERLDGGYS